MIYTLYICMYVFIHVSNIVLIKYKYIRKFVLIVLKAIQIISVKDAIDNS